MKSAVPTDFVLKSGFEYCLGVTLRLKDFCLNPMGIIHGLSPASINLVIIITLLDKMDGSYSVCLTWVPTRSQIGFPSGGLQRHIISPSITEILWRFNT